MRTFYSRFQQAAEHWPQAVALEMQRRDGLAQVRYGELARMAAAIGGWLRESGHGPGAHVAFLAANSPRWVAAYLGTLAAGCIAVPLDTALRPEQVAALLRDSGASLLFTDSQHLAAASQAAQGVTVQITLLEGSSPHSEAEREIANLDRILAGDHCQLPTAPGSIAAILYTSGTTADPKGVMLTQANLVGELEGALGFFDVGPGDAILGVLPLFHALAQMANLLVPLAVGARVVYLETLNTTELLRALREREITLFCCVPQFFYLIHERMLKEVGQRGLAARLGFGGLLKFCRAARAVGVNPGKLVFRRVHQLLGRRMRYLITGGSRFDAQVGRDLDALGFEILQAYGLTETTGGATCTPPGSRAIGSVGPPLPGVEVKLLDAQAAAEGGAAIGEVAIRGPIVMAGYYNRPDATAAVLQEGWLRTGDLGCLDARGNLVITGRKKEIIVLSSGKNIYPEEIEDHYGKSPFIREICLMGLESRPGEPYAEKLHAVVVPNFDVLRERKIVNAKEVIRFDIESLSAQLPASKRILSYEIWQHELPRTTTRKMKRFEIEQRVRQERQSGHFEEEGGAVAETPPVTEEDQRWLESPRVRKALEVIRQAARGHSAPIRPADNLELDLGLDSIQRVELLMALQQEFGAGLPESVVSEVYTVRELVDRVLAAGGSAEGKAAVDWDSVLQSDAADEFVLAATRRRPLGTAIGYGLATTVHVVAHEMFHLRVAGLENLPERGPCIICPNHQSFLDPIVLAAVLPWRLFREAFSLGTTEIFGAILPRRVARILKVIPVDPDSALVSALRAGAYGLRRGKVLVLFPEGERSIDGVPRSFKKGAAILATHLRVPIVPVAMDGFYEVWPRGKKYQGPHPLRMAFGEPLMPPADVPPSEAVYTAVTARLKARILEMWEKLHGSVPST